MTQRGEHDKITDSFSNLWDSVGRMFEQSGLFGGRNESSNGEAGPSGPQSIPANVFESGESLMVLAPMPGLQDEDVDITVQGASLTVEGKERADLKPESGKRYLRHEWRYGPYRRVIDLPYAVDAESATAALGNGVLAVRLQKAAGEKPRKITLSNAAETHAGQGEASSSSGPSQGGSGQEHSFQPS